MVVGGEKEPSLLRVPVVFDGGVGQPFGLRQPAEIAGQFKKPGQAVDEESVVVNVSRQIRDTSPIRAQEPSVLLHPREDELRGTNRRAAIFRLLKHGSAFHQAGDHQTVPGREDFVVEAGPDSIFANFAELSTGGGEPSS